MSATTDAIRCGACQRRLFSEPVYDGDRLVRQADVFWTTHDGATGAVLRHTCDLCYAEQAMTIYLKGGEIVTRLWTYASMCAYHVDESPKGIEGANGLLRELWHRHAETLRKVRADMKEVQQAARRFEVARWLTEIKPYYAATGKRGHSGKGDHFKALLWGCAGRVLLTMEPEVGGDLSLIFDETSAEPRGGIQGICTSKAEALRMLTRAREDGLRFTADGDVTLAGL